MTDYYSLIAEAIAEKREHETRIIIYERARAGLRELHKRGRLTSAELALQRAELDEAIRQFEADAWRRQRDLHQLKSVLAEVTQEQGTDPTQATGTAPTCDEDAFANPERLDLGQPNPAPTVRGAPDLAQFAPQDEAQEPGVVQQPDAAPAHPPEAPRASQETQMPDDVANSGVVTRSTGGDTLGSNAVPSADQVIAPDKDWEQAVDQAVAEVRHAADDQAGQQSPEEPFTDRPAATPASQRPTDASDLDQTAPGTASFPTGEQ